MIALNGGYPNDIAHELDQKTNVKNCSVSRSMYDVVFIFNFNLKKLTFISLPGMRPLGLTRYCQRSQVLHPRVPVATS